MRSISELSGRWMVIVRAGAFRRRGAGARQGEAMRQHLFLQAGILGAQPRDLIFEHCAIVRRRLAGPADGALGAHRHLTGLHIEPQESLRDFAETVAPVLAVGHFPFGKSRRGQRDTEDGRGQALVDPALVDPLDHALLQCRVGS